MKTNDTTAIIIGAGITGIGAAYYLGKNAIPYIVLEASDDVGGVWHTQRWHGARCDSDFVKYSFSFRPYVSPHCLHSRADIHRYLRGVAEEFGIVARTRFGTRVTSASFDSRRGLWTVETDRGTFTSRFLLNGNGYFSDPHVPDFPHASDFAGEIIHTFDLDAARRFDGKDVVLVGSGSTAICCAPELARVSGSLTMLQRSPSYVYEIDNRATPFMRLCQSLYRLGLDFPIKLLRGYLQVRDDVIFVGFRAFPAFARWFFRRHWLDTVDPAELRRNFTPRYRPQGGDPQRTRSDQDGRNRTIHAPRRGAEERRSLEMRCLRARHGIRAQLPEVRPGGGRRARRHGRHQFLQGHHDGRRAELLPAGRGVALRLDAALGDRDALCHPGDALHGEVGLSHREHRSQGRPVQPRDHAELHHAPPRAHAAALRQLRAAVGG
jgi:cation diffusion facilitator CzcD-associated flavoprotein CzcO